MRSVDLRVQGLDQQWRPIQANAAGIVPQGLQVVADEAGPASMTLGLARNPRVSYDDLTAFTPAELRIGGLLCWSGRIHETPTRDGGGERGFTVSGKGWQFHLDDDSRRRVYVHTDLGEWQDQRSKLTASLATYHAGGEVSNEGGAVTLRWPNATVVPAGGKVGATLDLGPDNTAKRVVMTWEHSNNSASIAWGIIAHNSESETGSGVTAFTGTLSGGATGTSAGTFSTAARYVTFYMTIAGGATVGADVFLRTTSLLVFTDTAYESGNASILKADTVIKDMRDRACPLLATTNRFVTAGTFSIPELASSFEFKTPREYMQQAASFEDYQLSVDVRRQIVFRARPTTPTIVVGAWSGCEFEDASANSGDDIYNRVVVEATGPDSSPLSSSRFAAQQNTRIGAQVTVTMTNPGFETGGGPPPSGWTTPLGTVAQDATTFAAGSNSGKFTTGVGGVVQAYATMSGLSIGRPYVCRVYVRKLAAWSGALTIGSYRNVNDAASFTGSVPLVSTQFTNNVWTPVYFSFVPEATSESLMLVGVGSGATDLFNIDAIEFYDGRTSLIDRRNFVRTLVLQSGMNLSSAAAVVLADRLLSEHQRAQIKGTIIARGAAAREYTTGRSIPAHELLLRPGENVLLSHLRDPDTGAMGRVARVRQVSYDHDSDSATLEIDNNRGAWDALLARLGALTGQVR